VSKGTPSKTTKQNKEPVVGGDYSSIDNYGKKTDPIYQGIFGILRGIAKFYLFIYLCVNTT